MFPCFIVTISYGYSLAHSWFNSYAPDPVPILYYRDKTRVHVFHFLSKKYNSKKVHNEIKFKFAKVILKFDLLDLKT